RGRGGRRGGCRPASGRSNRIGPRAGSAATRATPVSLPPRQGRPAAAGSLASRTQADRRGGGRGVQLFSADPDELAVARFTAMADSRRSNQRSAFGLVLYAGTSA